LLCGQPTAQTVSLVEPRPSRRDLEPHRGGLIGNLARVSLAAGGLSFLGIALIPLAALSVLSAAAGIGAVVMARDDLELMERQVMDPAGRSATLQAQGRAATGIVLGLAGALLSLLVHVPTLLA
jgi:hypothetical protein